jgi:hypothetical protein
MHYGVDAGELRRPIRFVADFGYLDRLGEGGETTGEIARFLAYRCAHLVPALGEGAAKRGAYETGSSGDQYSHGRGGGSRDTASRTAF